MKRYETKAETRDVEKLVEVVCDICGADGIDCWSTDKDRTITVDVSLDDEQFFYPDSGEREKLRVDLCPTCFKEKLIPWVRSQGAVVHEEKHDW